MVVTRCAIKEKSFVSMFDSLEDESVEAVSQKLTVQQMLSLEVMGANDEQELSKFSFEEVEEVFFNCLDNLDIFTGESLTMEIAGKFFNACVSTEPSPFKRRRIL